ncbi:MAG: AIR carboxylase family protein [Chloroflexi bacterium]|nr:AIR carboxylase family protein [Chloroflexota bacterium]
MTGRVVVIMGSKVDLEIAQKVAAQLDQFGVPYTLRVASAHKSVMHLMGLLRDLAESSEPVVLVTIAGRSNALSGMVDANTSFPVIACPPPSTAFGGADIFSSLRMPSGVAPLLAAEPENAAIAAVKILALHDAALREKVSQFQQSMTDALVAADRSLG